MLLWVSVSIEMSFTLCMLGFFHDFCRLLIFSKFFFSKNLIQECNQRFQKFGSRSGLIWVQTVCKAYKQTKIEDKELKGEDF